MDTHAAADLQLLCLHIYSIYKLEVVRPEMSNLWVVAHQQEELLLSAIITRGEQSAQIHGIHLMQQLYASSWDILHLVCIQ